MKRPVSETSMVCTKYVSVCAFLLTMDATSLARLAFWNVSNSCGSLLGYGTKYEVSSMQVLHTIQFEPELPFASVETAELGSR